MKGQKVVGYMRVSTGSQELRVWGWKPRGIIESAAEAEGWEVVEWFTEAVVAPWLRRSALNCPRPWPLASPS